MPSELLFFVYGVLCPNQPKDMQEAEEWSNRIQDTTEIVEVRSKAEKEFAIMQRQLGWRFGPTAKEVAQTTESTDQRYSGYSDVYNRAITR